MPHGMKFSFEVQQFAVAAVGPLIGFAWILYRVSEKRT